MQEGMLFHTISAPRSGFYFQQFLCTIKGSLDIGAFKLAWQRVMERHAVLRTCFLWERDGGPLQIALEGVDLPWDEHDWSGLSAHEQQAREDDFLRRDRERGFDLSNGPLMRLTQTRGEAGRARRAGQPTQVEVEAEAFVEMELLLV